MTNHGHRYNCPRKLTTNVMPFCHNLLSCCKSFSTVRGQSAYLQQLMAYFAYLFLLFLSIQLNSSLANITLSSSLTTNDNSPWLSPSQDFAFGFRQAPNSSLFLLAIWFNKIPERTIIWHAVGDKSINPAVPAGSKVDLTARNLVLTDPNGSTIWKAEPGTTISSAAMLDTGNFVLAGNGSINLWESFQHPTDTILPNQNLSSGDMLFSRLTATNYSKGRFQLNFINGNLQLNPIGWPSETQYYPYYSSNTYASTSVSESGDQLVFNESGNIYIDKMNGDIVQLPEWVGLLTGADYYFRFTLEFDGVFTEYALLKNSSGSETWSVTLVVPRDMCSPDISSLGSGTCGYNSYCSLENSRPSCHCPPRYVFADPQNTYGGCIPTFPHGCGQDDGSRTPKELYEMMELENIDFPLNDYEKFEAYNQTQCEDSCLHDCSCAVVIYRESICWKKRLPLSNGKTQPETANALFKVRKEVPPPGCSRKKVLPITTKSVVLGAFLGCSAFLNLLLLAAAPLFLFKTSKIRLQNDVQGPKAFETNLHSFSYEELKEATDCFQEELGRGSFGVVYKGVLNSVSRNVIAVKKLNEFAQEREREFKTEVSAIGKTHHKNLVRLLGYCIEGSNRLLIYEFMSNGTLASFLFTQPRPNWHQRVRIALGIARGLLYLHEDCDVPIIHCDIKPQNILLDDRFDARISDFGLAKLLLFDQTQTRTMIRGTRGYVAPEWFKNVPVSTKVDVYSFGVLLLEIICCRKSVQMELEEEERAILTDWAYDCYVERRIDLLVDNDEVAMTDTGRLQIWVMIAFCCIQEDPSQRPTMKMVVEMLEGFVEVPSPTCPFSFNSIAGNSSSQGNC